MANLPLLYHISPSGLHIITRSVYKKLSNWVEILENVWYNEVARTNVLQKEDDYIKIAPDRYLSGNSVNWKNWESKLKFTTCAECHKKPVKYTIKELRKMTLYHCIRMGFVGCRLCALKSGNCYKSWSSWCRCTTLLFEESSELLCN